MCRGSCLRRNDEIRVAGITDGGAGTTARGRGGTTVWVGMYNGCSIEKGIGKGRRHFGGISCDAEGVLCGGGAGN